MSEFKTVSVIIPLLNEEPNIPPLYDELVAAFQGQSYDYELVFIDDGSTDKSVEVLRSLQENDDNIVIVEFRRNFGQTAGLAAGLDFATGDVVIAMDADRQNDPADIPAMVAKLEEGYDMVCGWRFDRQDKFLSRRLPSIIANKLISWATHVKLHDYGCTLKAIRANVAKNITLYGEMHRFIPAVASWQGVKIAEVKVNHRARTMGESKYGISRTFRVIIDLITVKFLLGYSGRPSHFLGLPGMLISFIGGLIAFFMIMGRLIFSMPLSDRPLFTIAIMLVLVGFQFVLFGLLAELQIRTYYESQNKAIYVVKKIYAGKDKD